MTDSVQESSVVFNSISSLEIVPLFNKQKTIGALSNLPLAKILDFVSSVASRLFDLVPCFSHYLECDSSMAHNQEGGETTGENLTKIQVRNQ